MPPERSSWPNPCDERGRRGYGKKKKGGDSFPSMMPMLLSAQSVMVTLSDDRGVPCCSCSSLGVLIPASCLRGRSAAWAVCLGRSPRPRSRRFCQQASLTVAPRRQRQNYLLPAPASTRSGADLRPSGRHCNPPSTHTPVHGCASKRLPRTSKATGTLSRYAAAGLSFVAREGPRSRSS